MRVYKLSAEAYKTLKSLKLLSDMNGRIKFDDVKNTITISPEDKIEFEILIQDSLCIEGYTDNQQKMNDRGREIDSAMSEILFGQEWQR